MIEFKFSPNDPKYYTGIDLKVDLGDDSDIYQYFDAFKSFLYSIGFLEITKYEILMREENNDI